MRLTQASVPSRKQILLARHTRHLTLLGLLAGLACQDVAPPPAIEREPPGDGAPSTLAAGAPATYTDDQPPGANAADPASIIRIYKNHDAWRTSSDGGRDEATLTKMGMVRGTDFSVHPMSSLASGIPAGTRVVIITANSPGDAATSGAQRSAEAQQALAAFLETGGSLLLDLADNESAEGYRAPGAIGTPSLSVPTDCANATLVPAAFGEDGVRGTADDHRFVRGPDGLAGTADDINEEAIDIAIGASAGVDRTGANTPKGCSVVHGNLQDGFTLPSHATVLATANWPDGPRPVLAEYCHAGGRVIVNTFTLGYFAHKPREGTTEPLRSTYIQRSLFAYALSPESRCYRPPSITAPPNVDAPTDRDLCTATILALGTPHVLHYADPVTIERRRGDAQPLDAPYPKGETSVIWTVTDGEGETATASQVVSVRDLEKPLPTVPASRTVNADPGLASARVDVGTASATDNCSADAAVIITARRSDGASTLDAPYFVGTTTITWIARDEAGNEATAEQTIVVNDVEAPALTVPANFSVNATAPTGALVQYATSATDNVGVTLLTCSHRSASTFPIGVSTVSCTASDRAGNSTSGSFTVTVLGASEQISKLIAYVRGVLPPSATLSQLLDILRRAQAELQSPPDACAELDLFMGEVSANTPTVIPSDKAKRITADATRIKNVVGCPAG